MALVVSLMMFSCTTLPKVVEPGDTLVVGRAQVTAKGYQMYYDININGDSLKGIQLVAEDFETHKLYYATTDKDGYFYFKNLPVDHVVYITGAVLNKQTNSAEIKLEWKNGMYTSFFPLDNKIVNVGFLQFISGGQSNNGGCKITDFNLIEEHLKEINEESEWLLKDIIRNEKRK